MIIAGLIAGTLAFSAVWFSHHFVRKRLVALRVLRDRNASWQAGERIILSCVVSLSVTVFTGYTYYVLSLLFNPDMFIAIDESRLADNEGKEHRRGNDALQEQDEADSAEASADSSAQDDSLRLSQNDSLSSEESQEELAFRQSTGRRPFILVKRNFAMTLKGSIGDTFSVLMELTSKDRELTGLYYDAAQMVDARIEGKVRRNGDCVIHGYAVDNRLVGVFSGIFNNRTFEGMWQDGDGSRRMPFRLESVGTTPPLRGLMGAAQ